jgi:hypothetical protein
MPTYWEGDLVERGVAGQVTGDVSRCDSATFAPRKGGGQHSLGQGQRHGDRFRFDSSNYGRFSGSAFFSFFPRMDQRGSVRLLAKEPSR